MDDFLNTLMLWIAIVELIALAVVCLGYWRDRRDSKRRIRHAWAAHDLAVKDLDAVRDDIGHMRVARILIAARDARRESEADRG